MIEPHRVTLVTGASSGVGREIALHLSRSRRLILSGRDHSRLAEARALCQRPEEHVLWPLDLQEGDSIEASLGELIERNQVAIEAFVHSAGTLKIEPLRLLERSAAYEVMNVNFMSALELLRLLVRRKINGKHLRGVVFISSTASQFGARGFSTYCASKGALDAFMRAAAVELAPDVRVNSVLPGATRTTMTEDMLKDAELHRRMVASYPLGLGEPDDIAAAVDYLLSDKARWITGHQLVVDGGRTVNITA
jgi:NAD(P)-dependent dehydrogenase (short-subunit alcohol dehydrogenase family)